MRRMAIVPLNAMIIISGIFISGYSQTIDSTWFENYAVDDARKESKCQNFADFGATYEFKIFNGKAYYTRNGAFKGEFKPENINSTVTFIDHTTARNKIMPSSPNLTMITARNNRVMACADSNKVFWTCIVTEYKNDYCHFDTATKKNVWHSEDGCYGKVDPEENTSSSNPTFGPNDRHFYTLQGYKNTTRLDTLEFLKTIGVKFSGKMPDLEMLTTDTSMIETKYMNYQFYSSSDNVSLPKGPIFPDFMQVMVKAKEWHLMDLTPPIDGINSSTVKYNLKKKHLFHEATGVAQKVVNIILSEKDSTYNLTNERMFRIAVRKVIDDTINSYLDHNKAVPKGLVPRSAIEANVSGFNFSQIFNSIVKFYDENIDYAISGSHTNTEIDNYLNGRGDVLRQELRDVVSGLYYHIGSPWIDIMQPPLRNMVDGYTNTTIATLRDFSPSHFTLEFSTAIGAVIANYGLNRTINWDTVAQGLYKWYSFNQPSSKYQLIRSGPYVPGTDLMSGKKVLNIKQIYGIGINQNCRYEHYRGGVGGEYGAYYGKIKSPKGWLSPSKTTVDVNMASFDPVDGHGYIDGTCNFYALAKIGVYDANNVAHDSLVVLWTDEQEYFSERWRVLDPKDMAFFGIGGTFVSAFPVLTWFNGFDPDTFSSKYANPYNVFTDSARMATAGTAIVVANDDKIYSTSFYYAMMDGTWRWRNYPTLVSGETINKKSIKMREDMTIYFKGKKLIGTTLVDGYWYQQYLGSDYKLKGDPRLLGMPDSGFTHTWNFMGKETFEYADKNFYKMGMYDTTTIKPRDSSDHYCYKGYNPKVNVLKFPLSTKVYKYTGFIGNGVALATFVPIADVLNNNIDSANEFVLKDGYYSYAHYQYNVVSTFDSLTYQTTYSQGELNLSASDFYAYPGKYIYHPMYKDMDTVYKRPISLKFTKITRTTTDGSDYTNYYAYFTDPRNDDLNILIKPYICFKSKNGTTQTEFMIDNSSNTFNQTRDTSTLPHIEDLNVWADIPIDSLVVSYKSGDTGISYNFTINSNVDSCGTYIPKALKIGCIENGVVKILASKDLSSPMGTKTFTSNVLTTSIKYFLGIPYPVITTTSRPIKLSHDDWKKYFCPWGVAQYGTSAWIEDAFGNSSPVANFRIRDDGSLRIKRENPLANLMRSISNKMNN